MKNLSLTQLAYVVTVAETQNFSRAAEKMHITQPTLSMQIHKLEEEVGYLVFDRSRKPLIPTERGEVFIAKAREVLDTFSELEEVGDHSGPAFSRNFRLGVIPTLSADVLPRILPDLIQKYPQARVQISEDVTNSLVQKLRSNELDGAVLVTPLADPGLESLPLYYEPLYVYLPPQHHLCKRSSISPTDLSVGSMLVLKEGHCFRSQVLHFCTSHARKREESASPLQFESGSFETIKELVDKGLGLSILPLLAVKRLLSAYEIKNRLKPFAKSIPVREVSLVMRQMFQKRGSIQVLENLIKSNIPPDLREASRSMEIIDLKIS